MDAIREYKPRRLYIAADGPRKGRREEQERCRQVREIASKVDWDCEVKTLFRPGNLGCGLAVSTAISWFFENESEGIILEDDCLPCSEFFTFCSTLLERHRDDPKVATIGGFNCLPTQLKQSNSHYASKYFQMWGWASWRRFWVHYNYDLSQLKEREWFSLLRKVHTKPLEARFWEQVFRKLTTGGFDTWDFQVFYTAWSSGSVHLTPSANLVSNLGFSADATHTTFESAMASLTTLELDRIDDAVSLVPDPMVDDIVFYLRYLDSLTHTYWVEQIVDQSGALANARLELYKAQRKSRMLENELNEKRDALRELLRKTGQVQLIK